MKKIFLLIILFFESFICFSQKDTLYFIGEIRWGLKDSVHIRKNGTLGARIPYEQYSRRYKINNLRKLGDDPIYFSVQEYKKEAYYNKTTGEDYVVEVRIGVPLNAFDLNHTPIIACGDLDIGGSKKKAPIPNFNITIPNIHSIDSSDVINSNTFKLHQPLEITFPEDVSVDVITTYVEDKLYNLHDSAGEFSSIIKKYNFLNEENIEGPFAYRELMNLYKVLNFIEPYISSDAFLTQEASKLNQQLISENKRLQSLEFISKISTDSLQILKDDFTNSLSIYNHYLSFSKSLTAYYKQLKKIIFLNTPAQINLRNRNSRIKLGIGTGIFYGLPQVYNVTLSQSDTTVQFEKLSKVNAVVSAGMLFRLSSQKKDSVVDDKSAKNRNPFYAAINVNYYLSQNYQFSFPIGLSVGIGKQYDNFLFMVLTGIRKVRIPLTFFKNNFQNQKLFLSGPNNPPTTLIDPRDNNLFTDKYGIYTGISVFYIFKSK